MRGSPLSRLIHKKTFRKQKTRTILESTGLNVGLYVRVQCAMRGKAA
jgi:hypothetical protein